MKWPWVSRNSAERMIGFHVEQTRLWREHHLEQAATDRAEIALLQEKLLSLKMAGAVEVPKPPLGHGLCLPCNGTGFRGDDQCDRCNGTGLRSGQFGTQAADEMRELIHARAGSNYRMRNMMLSQLAVDRADGKDDDAIREAILNGVPSDGVPS